jgi:hypothetical protein
MIISIIHESLGHLVINKILMDIWVIGLEDAGWICLAQDRS